MRPRVTCARHRRGGYSPLRSDPRALVTGASSGIGAAFARALRSRGERLVLVARRGDRLRELAQELGGSEAAAVIPLDLSAPGAGQTLEEETRRRGFTIGLLVNNAGIGHAGAMHEAPLERLLGIVDLNVRTVVEITRVFLPGMVARGRGSIINVVSMSAFQPVPFLATYAASKAFMLSFTEAVAAELRGTGVRIQALCPGLVHTEFQATAGTSAVLFNRSPAMTADAVAAASLVALEKDRIRVIPGWRDRATVALQRWAPRKLVIRVAGELFRPR